MGDPATTSEREDATEFRHQAPGRRPYHFTVDDMFAMQRLGVLGPKGGVELIGGVLLMRSSDVPVRLHPQDLACLYEAGVVPSRIRTEMIDGVVYLVGTDAEGIR